MKIIEVWCAEATVVTAKYGAHMSDIRVSRIDDVLTYAFQCWGASRHAVAFRNNITADPLDRCRLGDFVEVFEPFG